MTDTSSTSRKRFHDVVTESLKDGGLGTSRAKKMIDIHTLSLEAIFHPKFENESRDQQNIRRDMIHKVYQKEGYLEVSLKHSGNLLLWSGGQRYYSKNATANAFTYVGEVLLRQHMERAWWNESSSTSTKINETVYQKCSNYVEKHRLTLSFEAVTSVLGHHGDLPAKDFLMLTAVADKAAQRFYSTVEVLELAQRFRLPHNDIWVYSSRPCVEQLFALYDTTRETGLAGDTIAALVQSANAHVSSMYPHVDFQGDILEGVVIRYVSYKSGEREQQEEQLRTLEAAAANILTLVPPNLPPCFELIPKKNSSSSSSITDSSKVTSMDIRKLYHRCIASEGYSNLTNRLGDAILEILNEADSVRRTVVKQPNKEWDVPKLVKELLKQQHNDKNNAKIDKETMRIANLIGKVDEQNASVRYAVHRENDSRWLCNIHVLYDKTFTKYQKDMAPGDLHLYRGFSIEMGVNKALPLEDVGDDPMEVEEPLQIEVNDDGNDARLMLKMKFLPYMVRTFCCRNGLKIISKSGPARFADYTLQQLKTWGMSKAACVKWQPFFRAWGLYAHECMHYVKRDYIDTSLPPMNEAFYLDHLEHFIPLYENGAITGTTDNDVDAAGYRAMVVVVAIQKETATQVAKFVSQELGGVRLHDDINTLSDDDFLAMTAGRGLIVSATIIDGFVRLRKYAKEYGHEISIILYGCDVSSIEASLLPKSKQMIGMVKGWEKTRVGLIKHVTMQSSLETKDEISIDESLSYQPGEDIKEAILTLKKASEAAPQVDARAGLLIFFPCIPGSGKSALSGPASHDLLNATLKTLYESNLSSGPQRDLIVLVGDKVKKKYWPQVKSIRIKQPASVFVADKNTPSCAWSVVGGAAGNGLVVPVVPDKRALSTTRIEGVQKSSGEVDEQVCHFYPFSLHYLAVCMARVMARPAKSHVGGLDRALQHTCMVVVKFFSLYRRISADEFVDAIRVKVQDSGSVCATKPIEVPFFGGDELPDLPQDVVGALTAALQMQHGYELERKNPETLLSTDPAVQDMEKRLRAVLKIHNDMLLGLSADEVTSRSAFVDQVALFTKTVCEDGITTVANIEPAANISAAKKIRLVSIDCPIQTIRVALKVASNRESLLMEALKFMGAELCDDKFSSTNGFEQNTHITMAHSSRTTQGDMRSRYESLLNQTVSVRVVGLLWSDRIAALAVELPTTAGNGTSVPESSNEFCHITLWRDGAKSLESNQLPKMVPLGEASEISFRNPFDVEGTFSFWE